MDDTTTAPIADPNAPQPDAVAVAAEAAPAPVAAEPEPTLDAFGLPPVEQPVAAAPAPEPYHPGIIERAEETIERFIAPRHPDDAVARCAEIIDNMHGSDEQRRQVVLALRERFNA